MLHCIWGREGAPALDLELVSFRGEIRGEQLGKEVSPATQRRPGRGFVESEASWALKRKQ